MKGHVREYRKLTLTLCAITAAAALLLSVVNVFTAAPIAARLEERRRTAMETVAPGGETFSQVRFDVSTITDMYAAYKGDTLVAYCVELTTDGFAGPITLLVGVSPSGSVTGVSMLKHTETPGLGDNADCPEFLEQFIGRSGSLEVGRGGVDAISGATVTGEAVARGVSTAVEAVARYQEGGGAQ